MATKKILFITRNFPPTQGGIETMANQLLNHQKESTRQQIILLHFGQLRSTHLPENLYRYHHLPSWNILSTFFFTTLFVPFFSLWYRPIEIINLQVNTALGSWITSRLLGIPYHLIHFGLELLPWKFRPYNELRGLILKEAKQHISISHYTDSLLSSFIKDSSSRSVILPGTLWPLFPAIQNQTSPSPFRVPINKNDFVCFSVGRLVPRKGFDNCIQAIALLIKQGHAIKYIIGGIGPDMARLEMLIQMYSLHNVVFLVGAIPSKDLNTCYANAHLFLQPSRHMPETNEVEGFGLVYLEAAACGTPSLGSQSGGIPDAILDQQTGVLVKQGDISDIATQIEQLIQFPHQLEQWGINAQKRVKNELNWTLASHKYWEKISNH